MVVGTVWWYSETAVMWSGVVVLMMWFVFLCCGSDDAGSVGGSDVGVMLW